MDRPDVEIIPPQRGHDEWISMEALERMVSLLDDGFRMPILGVRFGLDPIIGLIPGIGDFLSGLFSFAVVAAAWQRGVPRITLARMIANIAIDSFVGTIPVLGDTFDFAWKSNRMNFDLLRRHQRVGASHSWRDWAFFAAITLLLAAIVLIPILALLLVVHLIRTHT